jgi:hypothetical protein
MSQLQTCNQHESYNIIALDDECLAAHLTPGDLVKHCQCEGTIGTLVAVDNDHLIVLWTRAPNFFYIPQVRKITQGFITTNKITQIRPMSQPSSLIFY